MSTLSEKVSRVTAAYLLAQIIADQTGLLESEKAQLRSKYLAMTDEELDQEITAVLQTE